MSISLAGQACALCGKDWQLEHVQVEKLTPDGSQRRFCRLLRADGSSRVAIAPPEKDSSALAEAVAGWEIGKHLFSCGVPVPELFAFDRSTGLLVCEDLGDTRLHDFLTGPDCNASYIQELYEQAVVQLARMQTRSFFGFQPSWCWDTALYDHQLMLERESGYFLQALCLDMLHLSVNTAAITKEFVRLADWAAQADPHFFLHRDFQSRNIMILEGKVRFIDYQAGRLGPLGYDLASLLIDPYASLPHQMQGMLVDYYLDVLTTQISYNREQFKEEYLSLSLQRNLQILGAFAFLSHKRGKAFFQGYIKPALQSLQANLARATSEKYPYLNDLVEQCLTDV